MGVRLVSLTCWAFTTEPDSGIGFGDLCQNLATLDEDTTRPADQLRLRLPVVTPTDPTPAQQAILDRIATGAVAVPQRLETGEATVAFHRGALSANPAHRLPAPAAPRLDSAGEALIYTEAHGVFDTSYAAAFTAGRLAALADADFRTALMEFRAGARAAVRRLAAHPRLAGRAATTTARQLTAPLALEAFDRMLLEDNGAQVARALDQAASRLRAGRRRTVPARTRTAAPAQPRALLRQPGVADLLTQAAGETFEKVTAWLNRLRRLELIGTEHLVPDPRMLPAESIRFAYVDPGWIRAAVDGALSIGVGHTLDADLNSLATGGEAPPACAVLLRSSLVHDWPNTISTARTRDGAVTEPVSQDIYSTDTLLMLYPQLIDSLELAEPPRDLCFGIGDVGTIELRHISGDVIGAPMGDFPRADDLDQTDQFGRFRRFLRPGDADVLNLLGEGDALVPALSAELHEELPDGAPEIPTAHFALQMINAPQVKTFRL
ncbi:MULTISPECIES: hypothetical protein [Streptomycetaceae]|uniref:Uncharacterized protein n=1 Tax=Streptantibioticus cattleyicolor (strain ATCC 35852 / DSM 46488 / JCM 4925 / NBRC 14057 / NRRL 8057) TaxID=1003195 RepID=F8JS52_STREN|nr:MULTISPECIES: hypothetical protein [Streptomycetaceae]AEW94161.1 hypothetical protein SCATT_17900 [Streptantibioticus cattleyicolor NRRL 8057 = DSM 46488]MYS58826.1 hypothetical protein [Streptomyces sp. SID5468]CCB74516.1 protein of unknown function [Streptantibioticus cattleyicolor NRRL 8057 = DSM 46488]